MIYRNFRLAIFSRVAGIVLLSVLLAFIIVTKPMFFVLSAIVAILILLIVNLIRYIEKTNKDLTHFLLSIRQGGFTESYTSGQRGKQHQQLSNALNEIVHEFSKLNQQKELHYQFLQTLNENINVAILSFDDRDDLIMMNPASKRLLELPYFSKVEHFRNIDPELYNAVTTLQPETRGVVRVVLRDEIYQLSVQTKEIILQGKKIRIVLLQNLSSELETKEIEAWQQLIRVLTHEIMNSVTPIASLSEAVEGILQNGSQDSKTFNSLTRENVEDVFSSLATIQSRSKGLLKFVTSYKEFSRPIDARFEIIDIGMLTERIVTLLQPQIDALQITLEYKLPFSTMKANCDPSLLEQVLINVLKNAIEAVAQDGSGRIRITTTKQNQKTTISVADNGSGIDDETLSKIFIPFFTTKPKGSGIGLSLSKQIMKIHNGNIKVQTSEKGTVFVLEF
jgi:nitrogen fixation/metabolism regulation signal transduction histidine kinase